MPKTDKIIVCFMIFFFIFTIGFMITLIEPNSNIELAISSLSTFFGALFGAGIAGYLTLQVSKSNAIRQQKEKKYEYDTMILRQLDYFSNQIINKYNNNKPLQDMYWDIRLSNAENKLNKLKEFQLDLKNVYFQKDTVYVDAKIKVYMSEVDRMITSSINVRNIEIRAINEKNLNNLEEFIHPFLDQISEETRKINEGINTLLTEYEKQEKNSKK